MEKPLSAMLKEMKVGEMRTWPITKYPSIRSSASQAGLVLDRKYRIKADRETRTVSVTRDR